MSIHDLVNRYISNYQNYHLSSYNETQLRNDFLNQFFELLGWDIFNQAGKPNYIREVILEESIRDNSTEYHKKPDYTFRLNSERKFFLEAKKPSVNIETNLESIKQVRRYGYTANLKVSVISNFEFLIIYDTTLQVKSSDNINIARLKKYHYTEYIDKFEEIKQIIGKNSVYSGEFDRMWSHSENMQDRKSVDQLFLQQVNNWRILLAQELIHYPEMQDEQQLNDIVQSYITRIIFLRVCEDRNIETYQALLDVFRSNNFNLLIEKFRNADLIYNSGLFEQRLSDQIIQNISSIFWEIIRQLYYPESPYSFSVFSSDILGRIYEIFLSEKLTLVSGSVRLEKKTENIDRDVVTTPLFIINDILHHTVAKKCSKLSDKQILNLKIADISCGSGAFLLELFQFIQDKLIDYYVLHDCSRLIPNEFNQFKLPYIEKIHILTKVIYGVDKDYNAVEATKFGLLLKLLENEDISSTEHYRPLLPDLNHNIFFGNSLLTREHTNAENNLEINPFSFNHYGLRFDVIIGNPPYMMTEDMINLTPLEYPIYKEIYESAFKQFDKYYLFIEQGVKLLNDNGILGYIIPSKFTKVESGKKLRKFLTRNGYIQSLISFAHNQVFRNRTTYTCLIILTKNRNQQINYAEISDISLWQTGSLQPIFTNIPYQDLSNDPWVLVPPYLLDLYNQIWHNSARLKDIVGQENIFNGIQTSANDIYVITPISEDETYYYFKKDGVSYTIEKAITKPYFKTSRRIDNLNSYRSFKPNSIVFYPYEYSNDILQLIPLNTIQIAYPRAFEYISVYQHVLDAPSRNIQPTPQTRNEWHRYGRQQGLNMAAYSEKIVVGVLSAGDKYAVDKHGTLLSSGGTAGYCAITLPENMAYSIYYIQAILNSKYVEWNVMLSGEVFRGGYYARGTKVLNNLPIRKIDFEDPTEVNLHNEIANTQKELIEIYDQIDLSIHNSRVRTIHQRYFTEKKQLLDMLLANLYNLADRDQLIPLMGDYI